MHKPLMILTLLVAVTACFGCQTTKWSKESLHALNPGKLMGKDKQAAEKADFEEPVRMAVIWSEGVYDAVDTPKVNGFGGRIYFYNEKDEPVRTDGELSVYGYDDENQKNDHSANRKFVFRQSEFQSHHSKTSLGDSYSVWIPWEKVGGPRKSVSLIPIFRSSTGAVLRGDHSVNVLPGVDPETNEVIRSEIKISRDVIQSAHEGQLQNHVTTAAYEQDLEKPKVAPPLTTKKTKRPTTTIAVPQSMADRFANGQQHTSFPNRPKPQPKTRGEEKVTSETTSPATTAMPKTEPKAIQTFGLPGDLRSGPNSNW